MVLIVLYGGKIHFVEGSTVLPSIIAIGLIIFALAAHAREIFTKPGPERMSFYLRCRRIIRDWLPLIGLVGVYETLRDYTGIIRPVAIDPLLYALDVKIFGVEPVLWVQRFIHPLWTDYFAFMYLLYFFLPMLVATLLYKAGRRADFRELALSVVLCMYLGYILYLIFPAGPPRYFDLPFEPKTLTGYFGFYDATQAAMNKSTKVLAHSSFPSLHVALSTLAILHAIRWGNVWKRKWLIAINSWIAVSIWLATIYLRHHWTVDIFAGWILGVAAYFAGEKMHRAWHLLRVDSKRN